MNPPTTAPVVPRGQADLADILERVLDKGIVIAGDIRVNLLDIELLTIKIRLIVASVDRAREMGIDWWENDPSLTSRPRVPAVHQTTTAGIPGDEQVGPHDAPQPRAGSPGNSPNIVAT